MMRKGEESIPRSARGLQHLKLAIWGGALANLIHAGATASLAETARIHLPESDRLIEERDALEVNIDNVKRLIVRATEEDGILALAELARQSPLEEAWAFLPSEDIWVEIGRDECLTDHRSAVGIEVSYFEQLLREFSSLRLYHFHPEEFCAPRSDVGEFLMSHSLVEQVRSEDVRRIGLSLPSPADIGLSITLTELALEIDGAEGVDFAVVTPLGLVRYGPTPRGIVQLQRIKDYPFSNGPSDMIIKAVAPLGPTNIRGIIDALSDPTLADVMTELALEASGLNYRIEFEPIPDQI